MKDGPTASERVYAKLSVCCFFSFVQFYFSMKSLVPQSDSNKKDEYSQSNQREQCNNSKEDVPAAITLY